MFFVSKPKENVVTLAPHPGPSPRGEGESFTASPENERLHGSPPHPERGDDDSAIFFPASLGRFPHFRTQPQ